MEVAPLSKDEGERPRSRDGGIGTRVKPADTIHKTHKTDKTDKAQSYRKKLGLIRNSVGKLPGTQRWSHTRASLPSGRTALQRFGAHHLGYEKKSLGQHGREKSGGVKKRHAAHEQLRPEKEKPSTWLCEKGAPLPSRVKRLTCAFESTGQRKFLTTDKPLLKGHRTSMRHGGAAWDK